MAYNAPIPGRTNCFMNPAGIIYAVYSNDCPCSVGSFYNSLTCLCDNCWSFMPGCLECTSSSICAVCDSSNNFQSSAASQCQCLPGNSYDAISDGCIPVCGDGQLVGLETCDDKNALDGDGCSSRCAIQQYYQCAIDARNTFSTCWFVGPLNLNYLDIQKLLGQNKANITFLVAPATVPFSNESWKNLMTTTSSTFKIEDISYTNGLLTLTVSYNSTLDNQQLSITTTNQSARSVQLNPTDISFIAKTDSGMPPLYFDSNDQMWGIVEWIGLSINILYWLVFFIALYNSKIVGVEMMSTLQISLLSLASLNYRSRAVEELPILRYSMGWNPLFAASTVVAPQKLNRIGFTGIMMSDFNLMVLTLILFPVIAFCVNLARRTSKVETTKLKLKKVETSLYTDFLLVAALTNIYNVLFAFVADIRFESPISVANAVYGTIVVSGLLGVIIFYGIRTHIFQECNEFFKSSKVLMYQPVFMFIDRVTFSLLNAFIWQYSEGTYALLGWVFIYTVFIAIVNPYKFKRDYYRSLATQTATIVILCILCILANLSPTETASQVYTFAAFAVLIILIINLVVSLVFVILRIKQSALKNSQKTKLVMQSALRQNDELELQFVKKMREKAQQVTDKRQRLERIGDASFTLQ